VSPAAPLRTGEAPAAGVPPARPDRSGDRPVPVPRHPAGDHARAARPGLRGVFRRRRSGREPQAVIAQAPRDPLMQPDIRERLGEFVARAFVATLFVFLSINLWSDFVKTGRVTGLFFLASEALVVVLTIVRRPAHTIDRSIRTAV